MKDGGAGATDALMVLANNMPHARPHIAVKGLLRNAFPFVLHFQHLQSSYVRQHTGGGASYTTSLPKAAYPLSTNS